MNKPFDLSEKYWAGLSEFDRELYRVVRPLPGASYTIDSQMTDVEHYVAKWQETMVQFGGSFELSPDYQRGHVWTDTQRAGYVESVMRRCAPLTILFNCPGWSSTTHGGDIPDYTFQCIDGLQRLTAVRMFMAGEIAVFGGLRAPALKGTAFDPRKFGLKFSVYEFTKRADLLQFYLDLNGGGTVHSPVELDRVRALREAALSACLCDESALELELPKAQ